MEGERGRLVLQAFRFALEPSPSQERMLRSHAGAARFAWNWGLARCNERYKAERKWYSAIDLHKSWNLEKKADPALAWWAENSKCAYQEAFRNLDRALKDFIRSKKGERKGKRLGFPRFKKRGKCKDSFRFTVGPLRCTGTSVTLPRIGIVRTHESTAQLERLVAVNVARIRSATVSRVAQRWYVSFSVEVERDVPGRHARPGSAIGIDLGVKTCITGVDDQGHVIAVAGPKPLRASLRGLRRLHRTHSRKQMGSANRRKSAGRLARIHAKVANVRADAAHKATTGLARRYEIIVCEDLNVAGLASSKRIALAINDTGFGQIRRMLAYKTERSGGTLVVADRWYPSSKTCSGCGAVKAKLPLSERTYRCEQCGLALDRDENAARNLLKFAASGAENRNACGGNVRPGNARPLPLNQEPGTPCGAKTGTAVR